MRETKGAPIDAGIISRVSNGLKGFVEGITGKTWFSPGQPIPAQEPDAARVFGYDSGVNTNLARRDVTGVSFEELRGLADAADLVRLAIETRKDQLSALAFSIQAKDGKSTPKTRSKRIYDALSYPDQEHSWSTWLRMLIEDVLVIDAPTLYPRMTKGGNLYSLEVIDGSSIKRIIDPAGRTPLPPSVAYQQILYGIPAVNFNRDQIVYRPRNPRSYKIYGYSVVEQILTTLNIGLRRQTTQLLYFTEGNIPQIFLSAPPSWTPDQLKTAQNYLDILLSGDLAAKHKGFLIPDGLKPVPIKEPDLKTEFDEWLARIVCFAFSLPPTAFIKQINRSTAEAAQETALEEGLSPLKQWVKELMDFIIAKYFKAPDLEFAWQPGEIEQDPLTQSQIHVAYVGAGIMTVNEARQEIGLADQENADTLAGTTDPNDSDSDETEEQTVDE